MEDIVERAKRLVLPLPPNATTQRNALPSVVAGNDRRLNEFDAIVDASQLAMVFKCCNTVGGKNFIHCSSHDCTVGWWHRSAIDLVVLCCFVTRSFVAGDASKTLRRCLTQHSNLTQSGSVRPARPQRGGA